MKYPYIYYSTSIKHCFFEDYMIVINHKDYGTIFILPDLVDWKFLLPQYVKFC